MLHGRSGLRPITFDQTVRVCELLYKKLEIGEYAGPSGLKRINLDWIVFYTQSNGMGTALPYYLLHMYHYMVLGLQGGTHCLSSTSTQNSRTPKGKTTHWGPKPKGTLFPENIWISPHGVCYHLDRNCESIKNRDADSRRLCKTCMGEISTP